MKKLSIITTPIPIIELNGTYRQMGEDFGAMYQSEIHELAQSRMTRLINFVKKYGKYKLDQSEVLELTRELLRAHEQYDKNIWQEFEGIAHGANISLEWLLVLNGYTDLRDYICKIKGFNDPEIRFDGCTGFILDKTMSESNQIIIGQTWDMSVEAIDYLVIVKKNPSIGPRMMYLTTMGCLALIGLNQHNIAIGTTNLIANDCKIGVNYLHTISKALMAENYDAMLEGIIKTPRLSGHSFLCADDHQGNLLETSALDYVNTTLDHFPLVKTNHYTESKMLACQVITPEQRQRNSMYRYGRVLSLLCNKSQWTEMALWSEILSDCNRSMTGAAICNEDYESKYSEFATLATILLVPHEQKMIICRGGGAQSANMQTIVL